MKREKNQSGLHKLYGPLQPAFTTKAKNNCLYCGLGCRSHRDPDS